jgi:hypothetical protein
LTAHLNIHRYLSDICRAMCVVPFIAHHPLPRYLVLPSLYQSLSLGFVLFALLASLLLPPLIYIKKAPQARVGSQPLHRGREGVGGEEPSSDASSQVESEGSEPPPRFFNLYGVAVQCLFCGYYLFPVILVVIS